MSSSKPSIAELRAVAQPASLVDRRSAEHWAGRLYMRWVSIRVTRHLVGTRATPNSLTLGMIAVGLVAAAAVTVPGVLTAVLAAALIQVYLLLDCVDGEVARWRRMTSAAGVYLDRLGHHVVEAALVLGLGVRASGGIGPDASWWIVAGAVGALLVVLSKLESDLVVVARAGAGLSTSAEQDPESQVASVRRLRRAIGRLPVHRLIGAIELSLLLVVGSVVDGARGDLWATRLLLASTVTVAAIVVVGHPLTILTSRRLR
jgi:phosphatidylglycerophosphate synthase